MVNFEARIKDLEHKNSVLQDNFEKVLQLNSELREENKQLKKKVKKLEAKVSKLETELERYKVKPNEPPGSKPDFLKGNRNKKPKNKPGQKRGHQGKSRTSPKDIHEHVHYEPKYCEHCGCNNLENIKIRNRIITDLKFKIVNSKEWYFDMKCQDCSHITKPKSIHGTSKSPFGRTFQTLIGYLRSVGGMTIRPIENLFRDFFKFEVSDTSISNNEILLSKKSLTQYNDFLELVKQAQFSHKDETSYRVNGKTHWIWTYDSIDNVFYRMADSRGMKVVSDDFGLNCEQISINDCYAAYNRFERQQICWAHLLREAKEHSKKDTATGYEKQFSKELHEIYREALEVTIGDPPVEKRRQNRVYFENKLASLMLSLRVKSGFLRRICSRLNQWLMHCFLFVEVEGLPSTNNQAERSLRCFVIHRKASFGSKSELGAQAKVILKTLYENAKRRGMQLVYTLDHLFESQECVEITIT